MLTLAAALLAFIAPAAPSPPAAASPMLIEDGRIVRVSPRPGFTSGVLAAFADFEVEAPGGARQRMYLPWMTMDQFLPKEGDLCRIAYHRGAYSGVRSDPAIHHVLIVNLVDEISCD